MRHVILANPDKQAIALLSVPLAGPNRGARVWASKYMVLSDDDTVSFAKLDLEPMSQDIQADLEVGGRLDHMLIPMSGR